MNTREDLYYKVMAESEPPSSKLNQNQSERILYDIDVVAVWKPDDEASLDQDSDSQVNSSFANTNGDPSYSQLPKRVFKHVRYRIARSFEGLAISTTVPPALIQARPKVTSEWLMQLSPDGKYLAVLQEHKIEIRTSESGFEKSHAIYHSKRDAFPSWRRLAWSLDSKILAATRSDGTIEIINEDGVIIFVILSTTNLNSDAESDAQAGASFFLEPVAFLSFVDPKRGSDNPFKFEGQVYQYELIVITYDSVLRSYLLNNPEATTRRSKVTATYSREGASDPGSFVFYHKFYFKQWLSTVVCGTVVTKKGLLLCLGGKPNNEDGKSSSSVACWMLLQDRPFYRKLELEGATDVTNDDILNLSQNADDTSYFSRIKNIFSIWRKVNKSFTDEIVHRMILSPNQDYLLTLDFSGSVSLWNVSVSKGVVVEQSWNQSYLNYFARGREYKELSFEEFQEKKNLEIESIGGDLPNIPGLDNGKILSIGWWSDSALVFGYQSGSVIISRLPDMVNILGDSPEVFKSCLEIVNQYNCFLVIEHEVKLIRARVHGDNIISYSRAQEDAEMEDDGFEELQSSMSRLISAIAKSLHYVTNTFLWHFENDPSTIRGKFITISKRTFRLNRISETLPQDLLYRKINALEYDDALLIAETYNLDTDIIYQALWRDAEISETAIHDYLDKIHNRQWVLYTCYERITNSPDTTRLLLSYGLNQTDILDEIFANENIDNKELIIKALREDPLELSSEVQDLLKKIQLSESHMLTCKFRHFLLKYLDRLRTFEDIIEEKIKRDIENDNINLIEENDGNSVPLVDYYSTFAEDYAVFRDVNVAAQAMEFAADEFFSGLRILFTRHSSETLPYRFTILEQIPETADPNAYESFLPSVGLTDKNELYECLWKIQPWRKTDWVENPIIKQLIFPDEPKELDLEDVPLKYVAQYPAPSPVITRWYVDRAHKIDSASGQVDKALTLIRYGIEKNVKNLETLEENLYMLSKLVYECYPISNVNGKFMLLKRFEELSEAEIVQTFLSNEDHVVDNVKEYVLPFLKLLPARRARKTLDQREEPSTENSNIQDPMDLLYNYILDMSSTNLEICCYLFNASKPTLNIEDRIITSDEDLARVILACLYGNTNMNQCDIMARVFECLPIFEMKVLEDKNFNIDIELTKASTPHEFMRIFKTKSESQLQRFNDLLEIHLNAAEVLARYNNSVPLRWFIQSTDNYTLQKQLCLQLARKASKDPENGEERFESEEDWVLLLEDMKGLQGNGRGVLGKISSEELYKDFISGLLGCGSMFIIN